MRCTAPKADGSTCAANARGSSGYCRWHDPDDVVRQQHIAQSIQGGLAKAARQTPSTDSLATDPAVAALDLRTADGLRSLLAAMLRALTKLPVDVRLANAFAGLATAQRGIAADADIVARLEALEAKDAARSS